MNVAFYVGCGFLTRLESFDSVQTSATSYASPTAVEEILGAHSTLWGSHSLRQRRTLLLAEVRSATMCPYPSALAMSIGVVGSMSE